MKVGDEVEVISMIKVGIITAATRALGDRKDLSAPVIEELVKSIGGEVAAYAVVPDEQALWKRS